jgi:hypothetical protein
MAELSPAQIKHQQQAIQATAGAAKAMLQCTSEDGKDTPFNELNPDLRAILIEGVATAMWEAGTKAVMVVGQTVLDLMKENMP